MFKKSSVCFLLSLLLTTPFALTACTPLVNEEAIQSGTENEYQFNDEIHWNADGEAPHSFVEGQCSVCGYPDPNHEKEEEQDTSLLEFTVYDTHAVLTGIGKNTDKDLIIPATYMGKPVTAVGYRAFCYKPVQATFESITLPDSITAIEEEAFYSCEKLKSMHLGKGVAQIGELSLWGLSSLETLTVDEENPYYKGVDNVLFSKDGKHLVKYSGKKTDSEYQVPEGVEHIDPFSFHSCKNLINVVLPNGLKTIGRGAFSWTDHLQTINIPDGVTTIADGVFGYTVLEEVIFPDSVTSIGSDIFHMIEPLKKVHLGAGLATFPTALFCSNKEKIALTISENNPYFYMVGDVVYSKADNSVVFENTTPYPYY